MYSERGWSEETEWLGNLQGQVKRLQAQVDELMHAQGCIFCDADGCPALRAAARARGQQRLRVLLNGRDREPVIRVPGELARSVDPTAWWPGPPNF